MVTFLMPAIQDMSQSAHNYLEPRDRDTIRFRTTSMWIPRETDWTGDWELTQGLVVNFQTTSDGVIAVPQLEGINEYGEGNTLGAALLDLLTSFAEYRESLEEREERLHQSAVEELAILRGLVRRKATVN